jgi:hypothetical protein
MKKEFLIGATLMFLLCGTQFADQKTNWASTSTDPEIQYRTQVYSNSQACYLEFRDQQQGDGPTTFDAQVNYKSTEFDNHGQAITKIDRENIVTTADHVGSSRISNCTGVLGVRLGFVQRE